MKLAANRRPPNSLGSWRRPKFSSFSLGWFALFAGAIRLGFLGFCLPLLLWTSSGAEGGEPSGCQLCLSGPDNMVFDTKGNMYLTDNDHKSRFRVVKISATGQVLAHWQPFGKSSAGKQGPEGIALATNGDVWVTDAGARAVLRLSPEGKVVGRINAAKGNFSDLGHVATDSAGNVYVAEASRNLIQKFSAAGERLALWGRPRGTGVNQWNLPETIAVRSDNSVVVEDWGNHRIVVLSPLGRTLFSFGEAGSGPGQFRSSAGLAVDHRGDIYVADDRLHRVQEFDPSGRLLGTFPKETGGSLFSKGPGAVAIDGEGNLYAPDGLSIVKISPEGRLLARWR